MRGIMTDDLASDPEKLEKGDDTFYLDLNRADLELDTDELEKAL